MGNRVSGRLFFSVDSTQYDVTASVTYNLGIAKRESMSSAAHEHFYKETAQVPHITGTLMDNGSVDVAIFLALNGVTITAELANGKTIVLRRAWQVDEGEGNAEDGTIAFKFEGKSADEVRNG